MKRIVVLLTGLLCLAPTGRADVFVYRNKLNYVDTGAGQAVKLKAAGWTVINDAGDITQILAFTAQKRYAVVPMQSIEYGTTDADGGRQTSYFIQNDTWTDGDAHTHTDTGGAQGLNFTATVNGHDWSIPKTFSWSGRSVGPASSAGGRKFEESSGSLAFDKNWTATCNENGDDLNAATQRLVDALNQQGYQPF